MTLDLNLLKSNMAELCSAARSATLVPSISGKSVYDANRGFGIFYSYLYVLCSYSGKNPPVAPLLKQSLSHTREQYALAVKVAKTWAEKRARFEETDEKTLEVVVFLASFHKACKTKDLLNDLQSLFQHHLGLTFNLVDIPNLDFYRRVDVFERTTSRPFPFALIKDAILNNAPDELRASFHEYEGSILEPNALLSDAEKIARKARIVDKLLKILKDLGSHLAVDRLDVYAIWGRMGSRELLSYVSEKRKRTVEKIEKFRFENSFYTSDKTVTVQFNRPWTAVPLLGSHKEVIVFPSVLTGAFLSIERQAKEIIPINKSIKYNPELGLLLKKGHSLSWKDAPLEAYEKELVKLIDCLVSMSHLPVEACSQLMELESYGFDKEDQLTVKLNYIEAPYHIYILHDFLFKASKKNPKDYIRLVKAAKLDKAPMGHEVGRAFMAHLGNKEKFVKFAASEADATEHDYQKYWVDPFLPINKFLNESNSFQESALRDNYLESAYGCYPFEGVLDALASGNF